jgi:uncharacterized FAD-dependent dehydrogenase
MLDHVSPTKREMPSTTMCLLQQMPAGNGTPTADFPKMSHEKYQVSKEPKAKLVAKPKRPLTAYNLFFRDHRIRLLTEHSKHIGFESMGRMIASLWKEIDHEELQRYEAAAAEDKKRYNRELVLYKERKEDELEAKRRALELSVPHSVKEKYFSEHQHKKRRMS